MKLISPQTHQIYIYMRSKLTENKLETDRPFYNKDYKERFTQSQV